MLASQFAIPHSMTGWVLGCHRSGTSLLCSILRSLSNTHRDQLLGPGLPANPENPAGHHESAALVAVNEQLLGWAGYSWDRPFVAQPAWSAPASLELLARLRGSLASHADNVGWIDKDPRLCLTRDAFTHLLLRDPAAIAVMRDPLAVAVSLHRRNGFSLRKAAAIWLLYNLHLFNSRSRPPETVILFDDLVSPDEQIQSRVARDLAAFSVTASGQQSDTPRGALEQQAFAVLDTLRRYELVRSENHWRDDQEGSLVETLEDIWRGCQDIVRGNAHREMAAYLRHAWATVSPILEPEVAIPLHQSHELGEKIAKSLGSLRGRLALLIARGPVARPAALPRSLGNGSAASDPSAPGVLG